MKISQLKGKIQEVEIVVPGDEEAGEGDEVVKVKFRPAALDLDSLEKFSKTTADVSSIRMFLEPILVSWDLQDDDGRPLGVTGEDLGRIPVDFLTQVLDEITSAVRPNPQKPETSDDGSLQTENSGDLQNGTGSFSQPNTLA